MKIVLVTQPCLILCNPMDYDTRLLCPWDSPGKNIGVGCHFLPRNPRLDLLQNGLVDLLANQGTLNSLLQHHSSKASILRHSAFFTVQLSHPYMTTGKTTALTRRTLVGKVMSLPLNMLSRLVITFLPRSKHLLISCLGDIATT